MTPLHCAVRQISISETKYGNTPLLVLVHRIETVVELLINKGADVNMQAKNGYTPLHIAAQSGIETVVELLINKGADVNMQAKDGYAPLHEAAHSRVVELLINKGANINVQSINGFTPLHIAVRSGKISVVKLLLDKGANKTLQDIEGNTPLHEASRYGELSILELLLDKSINVNEQAKDGSTLLHQAVQSKEITVVELLLNNGAEINVQSSNGDTPLHVAVCIKCIEIVKLLIHRGADAMIRNKTGDTPRGLHYDPLSSKQNNEIVSLLLESESKTKDFLNNNQLLMVDRFQSKDQNTIYNKYSPFMNDHFMYSKLKDTSGAPGQFNESKMVSLMFMRVINHDQIEHDIFLGANIDGIGAMDDICLRYQVKGQQRPVVLFIQVKHRKKPEKEKLTNKDLWSNSGDFCLRKYFKSYLMIKERFRVGNEDPMFEGEFNDVDCYFVLYTSAKENFTKKETDNKLDKIVHNLMNTGGTQPFQYSYDDTDLNRLTKVATEAQIKKLKENSNLNLNPIDYDTQQEKDFFSRLWFYSDQAKEDEIEQIIQSEISKSYNNERDVNQFKFALHSNAIFLKVHYLIQQWWKLNDEAPYLSRSNDIFSYAKLECLDDVLLTVLNAMFSLKMGLDLKFSNFFKPSQTSILSSSACNTIGCRLMKVIDKENKLITVDIDLQNEIVNLLFADQKSACKNTRSNSDRCQTGKPFCINNNHDAILNNYLHNNCQFKYSKKAGTSEVGGTLFRVKMLSLIYLRALNHEQIEQDLLLGTKIQGISVMSDICLRFRVKDQQRPVVLFVQLIHRDNPEKGQLAVEELWNDSENFRLRKYFASYLEIKDRFQVDNKDPMFEGDFCDVDCNFFLYTSAKESFTKKSVRQVSKVVQELLRTRLNTKPFQYDHDEADIRRLIALDQIEKLGTVFLESVMSAKYNPNILRNELIAKYHVALGREVLKHCETQLTTKEYRVWEFRPEFFDSKLDYLVTLLRAFTKFVSLKRRNQIEFKNNVLSDDERIKLEALKIKLPLAFGNLDMAFRGSDDSILKRKKYVAEKIVYLLQLNEDTKIIEINDKDVGPGKTIEQGIIDINGGIGGAVGNLLILDTETNMLKFDLENEALPHNAASFLKELKYSRTKQFNEDLSSYRIKINIKGFPKYSFSDDEYDKIQVRDFLSKFWLYPGQAKEDEVERILKDVITKKYADNIVSKHTNNLTISGPIVLHYLDEMQKWWVQTSESPYLSRASQFIENAELAYIDNKLQTIINFMYITNTYRVEITIKQFTKYEEANVLDFFRQMSSRLCHLFDQQYNDSDKANVFESPEFINSEKKLSISIHPEMEWVAIAFVSKFQNSRCDIVVKVRLINEYRQVKVRLEIGEEKWGSGPECYCEVFPWPRPVARRVRQVVRGRAKSGF